MTYDFMARLAGIATTEIKYPDTTRFVGHVAASQIVAAEIIANAIKEAAHPAKSEPLTIEIKSMANDAVYYDHIIGKLRDAGLK